MQSYIRHTWTGFPTVYVQIELSVCVSVEEAVLMYRASYFVHCCVPDSINSHTKTL